MGAFAGILEAFVMFAAEQERANITRRTSAGRAVKAVKGGYAGGDKLRMGIRLRIKS